MFWFDVGFSQEQLTCVCPDAMDLGRIIVYTGTMEVNLMIDA